MKRVPNSGHEIGNQGPDDASYRLPHENIVLPDGMQPERILERQRAILQEKEEESRKIRE